MEAEPSGESSGCAPVPLALQLSCRQISPLLRPLWVRAVEPRAGRAEEVESRTSRRQGLAARRECCWRSPSSGAQARKVLGRWDRPRHVPLLPGRMPLLGIYAANFFLYTIMSNQDVDAGASCSGRRRCTTLSLMTPGRNGRWCTRCLIRPQPEQAEQWDSLSLFGLTSSSCSSSQSFSCSSSQILEAATADRRFGGV